MERLGRLDFTSADKMVFELLRLNIDVTDEDFNSLYPEKIKVLSRKHWTPVSIAKLTSEFLVGRPGTRVLDVGSGAGKFCMIGAVTTKGHFTGIEQRSELVDISNRISAAYKVRNVEFIHANMTSISFQDYDAFYFYNSFYENIDVSSKIDETVNLNEALYDTYSSYLTEQLESLPVRTRLVTFCSPLPIVPRSFKLIDSHRSGLLKFWEKRHASEVNRHRGLFPSNWRRL